MPQYKYTPEQIEQFEQFWKVDTFNEENLNHLYDNLKEAFKEGKHMYPMKDFIFWKRGDKVHGIWADKFISSSRIFGEKHILSFQPIKDLFEEHGVSPILVVGPYQNFDPRHSARDIERFGEPKMHFNVVLVFDKEYFKEFIKLKQKRFFKKTQRHTYVDQSKIKGFTTVSRKSVRKHTTKQIPSDTHIDHVINAEKSSNPFTALSGADEPSEIIDDSEVVTEETTITVTTELVKDEDDDGELELVQ